MLGIDMGPGDKLRIGEDTYITVARKSGARARLHIDGSAEVLLIRKNSIEKRVDSKRFRAEPAGYKGHLPKEDGED